MPMSQAFEQGFQPGGQALQPGRFVNGTARSDGGTSQSHPRAVASTSRKGNVGRDEADGMLRFSVVGFARFCGESCLPVLRWGRRDAAWGTRPTRFCDGPGFFRIESEGSRASRRSALPIVPLVFGVGKGPFPVVGVARDSQAFLRNLYEQTNLPGDESAGPFSGHRFGMAVCVWP